MQTGYLCRLRITERSEIQFLIKNEIRRLTKVTKKDIPDDIRRFARSRKGRLAKIYSKMEHLDMS